MSALAFTERMAGFVDATERDYNQAWLAGRRAQRACAFELDIEVDDVARFVDDDTHEAHASGHVDCDALGGRCRVDGARFNLLPGDGRRTEMRYVLPLVTPEGRRLQLHGFKHVEDGPGFDVWAATTTLFTEVRDGADVLLRGILRISRIGFLRLLTTMRADHPDAMARFGALFLGRLWDVYGGRATMAGDPAFPRFDPYRGVPAGTWVDGFDGWEGLTRRIVPFVARDGNEGTLHQIRSLTREPDRGPVLCIHGAGVRGDLFLGPPSDRSFVRALVDAGYEVWLENWRASIDFLPSAYTLDSGAAYDHPAAITTVLAETGAQTLKVVAQCQGSTSFVITALAGLAPQVTHVVSNAVSLHPKVPRTSFLKVSALVPLLARATPLVDAQWAVRPPSPLATGIAAYAKALRRECDEPACALATYMYGTGPDVIWVHDHLDPATHHWVAREFSWCSLAFLSQMRRSVRAGHLMPVEGIDTLPDSYVRRPAAIDARWTFVAGTANTLYLPMSQGLTHAFFDAVEPGRHTLRFFEGYGHLDPIFGKDAGRDTFPTLLRGLDD